MEWLHQKMNLKQILYISVAGMSPAKFLEILLFLSGNTYRNHLYPRFLKSNYADKC